MIKITGSEDYYPTPESLLQVMIEGLDWEGIEYILEPSAGSGNIAEYVQEAKRRWSYGGYLRKEQVDIDCIEIEADLRAILKDKGLRVVHDDFLTYQTYKHYDLILMNPPFSQGARHLLKALELQSVTGGQIVSVLNAETVRNAYTMERKELMKKLTEYDAEIKYYAGAFSDAENATEVEVAVIKVEVPAPERETTIYERLRTKEYKSADRPESWELAESDLIKALVAQYNREIEWGLKLSDELLELESKAMDGKVPLKLEVSEDCHDEKFSVNGYVKAVRRKYWKKFFAQPLFYSRLTSNLATKYTSRVERFAEYEFSYWNIKTVQEEIARSLMKGVEECIVGLFDELSHKYSWSEELELDNIHYYNGWKTNISWKINKRVIIRLTGYHEDWRTQRLEFEPFRDGAYRKLSDIEKVLNYLDSGETTEVDISEQLHIAQSRGQTRKIRLKYFEVTFYKKGTCHITFTNERLLKKLNIYGSQSKGWLPYGYGRKRYEEFDEDSAIANI